MCFCTSFFRKDATLFRVRARGLRSRAGCILFRSAPSYLDYSDFHLIGRFA